MRRLARIEAQLRRVYAQGEQLMGTVAEYVAATTTKFDELEAAIGVIDTGVDGLGVDIAWVKAQLEIANNSPGTFTPADQITIDGVLARLGTMVGKSKALADKTGALDAATTPPPPPTA
jgi:hypothetical protein